MLDALLHAISTLFADAYAFIRYARTQARIKTATGGFLDLIALDFFDPLRRGPNETDASLRRRILVQLFLEKGTRYGLVRALELLTGRTPVVFEPARPADTGAYGTNTLGYGAAGGYGSLLLPHQAFVTAYRPIGQGIPGVAGYGNPQGGYSTFSRSSYASLGDVVGAVTDASIYAAIDAVMPVGTVAWTRIVS